MDGHAFPMLSLDGGGSRGAFTLGALAEIEALLGKPLAHAFRLMYGTSSGAIIAAYLATGHSVQQTYDKYLEFIPKVMSHHSAAGRTRTLTEVIKRELGDLSFKDCEPMLAIVATRCDHRRPLIFKSSAELAQGRAASFVPGKGVPLWQCLVASSAAVPFFERCKLVLDDGDEIEAIDGGFVANNPAIFALVDAEQPLALRRQQMRLCSIGTGDFPLRKRWWHPIRGAWPIALLESTLESSSNTVDILRKLIFQDAQTVRINGIFRDTALATDLLESDPRMLKKLFALGRESFATQEQAIANLLGAFSGQA